jgi:bifunctional non-homologous end joining protein LigD
MPLEVYRKKRKFDETPEPSGRVRRSGKKAPIFVVQKHAASSLHYDFRLEIDGVLVSWAIPKGPSLNPSEKRLAVMTEDHPMDYAEFEGVIPQGHYGGGTVMVWDHGTYEVLDALPAGDQLKRGEIKVRVHGHKLKGEFVLIHTGARAADASRKKQWLLIKHRDEYATAKRIADDDRSALTGRTLEEIAKET